MFLDVIP